MKAPEFNNGDIVIIDPTHRKQGSIGKIIGTIFYIDDSIGYVVSVSDLRDTVVKHVVNPFDLMLYEQKDNK